MTEVTDHDRVISIGAKLDALKELINSRMRNIEQSTTLATNQMERRLEGMNEFRDQLKDQASRFITRAEYDILVTNIQELRETRAMLAGKASQSSMTLTTIIAFTGLIIGVAGLIFSVVV